MYDLNHYISFDYFLNINKLKEILFLLKIVFLRTTYIFSLKEILFLLKIVFLRATYIFFVKRNTIFGKNSISKGCYKKLEHQV